MRRHAAVAGSIVCAVLALAPAAYAGVDVTSNGQTVSLVAPGARVVIARNPFRLAIQQPGGQPALAEVANRNPRPLPIGPLNDPFGSGLNSSSTPTVYAPLTFLVGSEQLSQYEGGLWGGNLMAGTRVGVLYAARRIVSVAAVPGGVRLTVSTDDPSGRQLVVTVSALSRGAIGVSATPRPAQGVAEIGDSFASTSSEGFFGFGGRHNAVDQRGETLTNWVSEENVANYLGNPDLYPNGNTAAYYPQAEFFSTRPYGFLLAQPDLARFKLDVGGAHAWNVMATAQSLRYVVAPGAAPHAIATLTELSGRQPVPPRWGLGPMLDRLVTFAGETTADYEHEVESDLVNIARYKLRLTAYRLEGWGYPTPGNLGLALHTYISPGLQASVIATLRRRGIHPLVYLRPWITPGSAPVSDGLVVRTGGGQPFYTTGPVGQPFAMLDFTNPAAVHFWQHAVAEALDTGADGFMQDYGEEVLFGMHFHNGQTGATMHNEYPVLYARATRQELTRYESQHPGRRLFFFTRAGYSGLPGSAADESTNFPGDETTDYGHASGLASLTSDMLGRAVDGAYGFGTDIGGYYDITTPPTTKQLFLRWAEWAALSPVFRLHGSGLNGTHTPWSYDAQTVRVYRALSLLHLRAVPLIMSLWRIADRTGMPITRPLWLADPHDPRATDQDQEWLLGPNLLVAPIVAENAVSRGVFFPRGCWRSTDGGVVHGPRDKVVHASLTRLPYFTRCGTNAFAPLGARPRPARPPIPVGLG
jgi:alpha-glucosidase (family GH31 glycosyl hydrolase)